GLPRRLGHCLRGGVRELVAAADDKGRKGVARIEARLAAALQRSGGPLLPLARGAFLSAHLRTSISRVFWAILAQGYTLGPRLALLWAVSGRPSGLAPHPGIGHDMSWCCEWFARPSPRWKSWTGGARWRSVEESAHGRLRLHLTHNPACRLRTRELAARLDGS